MNGNSNCSWSCWDRKKIMVKKELLIIIPAFNEENNIVRVFEQLEKLDIPSMADILVIDDASTDQTDERVRERRYGEIINM